MTVKAVSKEFDEAHNTKIEQLEKKFLSVAEELTREEISIFTPLYAERSEVLKEIPKFWLQVFANFPALGVYLHDSDHEALSHLIDITITTSSKDLRTQTIEFHFSPNKFFSNKTLTKTFSPIPGSPNRLDKFSLSDHSQSEKVEIDWSNDEVNLTKLHPTKGIDPLADGFDPGSFFSVFFQAEKQVGLDSKIADEIIDVVYPNAVEIFTGEFEDEFAFPEVEDEELLHRTHAH